MTAESTLPKGLHYACRNCQGVLLLRKDITMAVTYNCTFTGKCTACGKFETGLIEIQDEEDEVAV